MLRRVLPALLVIFAVGCEAPDPSQIIMPPRFQAQTDAEVAFVTDLFNALQPRSINQGVEYCGLIGVDNQGRLVATPARRGTYSSCLPPSDLGPGVVPLASYHTHGAYDREFLTEVPSYDDMRTDIEDGTDGYIATPGGRLWYVDARAQEARLICGAMCLVSDVAFEENPAFPVRSRYTLQDLAAY